MESFNKHKITFADCTLEDIGDVLNDPTVQFELSEECSQAVKKSRDFLESKLKDPNNVFYGINTGFGDLCNERISPEDLSELQHNLILSHACGTGDEVPLKVVRLMHYLKIRSLSRGYSGIRSETIERLLFLFNKGVVPVIPTQGSLGASGDLAPLAHFSLALIGEGKVYYEGIKQSALGVHQDLGISPLKLGAKEGLALLNGTQFMQAFGTFCLYNAYRYFRWATFLGAASLEGFRGSLDPFFAKLHEIRPHPGQLHTSKVVRDILEGSGLQKLEKTSVQDPYSFRCIPQVHGASWDCLEFIKTTFLREANCVTDNPNIFPDEDKILSGGNFHGQPLAIALDLMCISLSELGSISERRVFQLLSGSRGLPPFLAPNPGLHSGLMIIQYTAAALASENKQFCTPSSADSIPSSNGQEDHVSMGANGAVKCFRVLKNLERILALELITAAQALYFREESKSSPLIEKVMNDFREVVPPVTKDRNLSLDISSAIRFIKRNNP